MTVADGGGGSTSPTPTAPASTCTAQSSTSSPPPPPQEEEHHNAFRAFGQWLGDHKAQIAGFVAGTVVAVGREVATAAARSSAESTTPAKGSPPGGGAGGGGGGAARSTNFIAHLNGDMVPVPEGAVGPPPVDTGKGFQLTGGSGGHGLDPRTTDVRIMDQVTGGKYAYPPGYVSYSNASGQPVNPYTGQTVGTADPWWHWPF